MFEAFAGCIGKNKGPNRFWHVDTVSIDDAEAKMGMEFPIELREFFVEAGSGFWAQGEADSDWDRSLINRILSPEQIADLVSNAQNTWRPSEGFVRGAIPFFDVGENTYFIVPEADSSCVVFWPDGKQVVSKSINAFFANLQMHAGFYLET